MALETIIASVTAIMTVVFGGGLLSKHNSQLKKDAVIEFQIGEIKIQSKEHESTINAIKTEQALQKRDIESFGSHIKKLEMLPEIQASLKSLGDVMNYLKEQFKDFKKRSDD